jgi:putative hemolysin
MPKLAIIMTILAFVIIGIFGVRFFIGGSEDNWICQNNTWVKHGNPSNQPPTTGCGEQKQIGMPNPASVYCIEQGGKLDIVTEASSGGEIGICKFTDGKSCEEWDFFRTKVCASSNSAQLK